MRIWAKTEQYKEGKFLVVRRDGSVPHWPHFVLGARDPWAAVALRVYADVVESNGGDREYAQSVRELASDFDEYRRQHGNGDPDAGPHRRDDASVIRVMRGGDGSIWCQHDTTNARKG